MRSASTAAVVAPASLAFFAASTFAAEITNPGFEDTTGQTTHVEFTFGTPAGWSIHNPNALELMPGSGVYIGTLQPNGTVFFDGPAPEGDRVAILFNAGQGGAGIQGQGEYGIVQTLTESLQPNTQYTLTVAVGNIASGTAQDGRPYDLSGFPGYRVDLLAGGTVLDSDDNTLVIDEGQFATSTVLFTTGDTHPQLGQMIGIRLVNLNAIPDGYSEADSPDLEVDFDDVLLIAQPIPEPSAMGGAAGLLLLLVRRR